MIYSNDIKIYQAQDNTDNDSGGGSRTSVEIIDGAVNNLFPDISRLAITSGDVSLRKAFPTVVTENRDVYYGAHAIIRKTPSDPKVSSLLFHTDDPTDKRISAQDKIESYVTLSYLEQFYLYGNTIEGSRAVTFLQTIESQPPQTGEVYVLKEGTKEQYIRIVSIEATEVNIPYAPAGQQAVNYLRRRILCELDQPIEHSFTGSIFHPSGQQANTASTYATQVSDAAKFFGTKILAEDAFINNVSIKVDSIYEQLVPASKKQTPLVNQSALLQTSSLINSGNIVNESVSVNSAVGFVGKVNNPIYPGTISFFWSASFKESNGYIVRISDSAKCWKINYEEGSFETLIGLVGGGVSVSYQSATVVPSKVQFSDSIKITLANQGYFFVRSLNPMPSVGDLYVDYRSQGKWYRFASNPDGTLGTDPTVGSGELSNNFDGTGTVSITLGSLPDVDSTVIVSWGSTERLTNRTASINANSSLDMVIDLGKTNIDPTSFSMVAFRPSHGNTATITANAAGVLSDTSGTINGRLDYLTGELRISKTSAANRFDSVGAVNDVVIDFDYSADGEGDAGEIKQVIVSATPSLDQLPIDTENTGSGTLSFSLSETVQITGVRLNLSISSGFGIGNKPITLISDSVGDFYLVGKNANDNTVWGTIAVNGDVSITFPQSTQKTLLIYGSGFTSEQRYSSGLSYYFRVSNITVDYRTGAPTGFGLSHNITDKIENIASYHIKTIPNIVGEISAKLFKNVGLATNSIISKNGVVYNNVSYGVGNNIGTIDYNTGEMFLNYVIDPGDFYLNFTRIFSDDIGDNEDKVLKQVFRTSASKLTLGSLQLKYETANGTYTAQGIDANGLFIAPGTDIDTVNSYVDTKTGMVSVIFTSPTIPESIKYDAVSEVSLPLDPELLGLNPVRLPSDGRVPVFSSGRHLVIFNEVTTAIGSIIANQVETLARNGQSYIEVIDVNKKRLSTEQYVADREAGTVTFNNDVVLEDKYGNALTAPFSIVDRVEDMVMATDVQVNGIIELSAPLTHDYTSGNSYVASALILSKTGDIGARVYELFNQEFWNAGSPVWADELIGDATTSKYDEINYPIQIDNKSSTSGRWAIIFTGPTTVKVAHEKLGIVQDNISISIDHVSPINPATGAPYFTMDKAGFGAGWIANNVIRFNTDSGDANMWVIRTIQSGALSEAVDSIELEIRGDAN